MKKKTFLPYAYWPLIIIALMFVLMMMLGAIVGLIGFFVVAADNIWAALFVFAGAILMLFVAAWLACCIFMELSVAMCPISIDEEGVTLGLFKRRSYPWAELSQFGITLLNPPPRNHPHPKLNQEIRPRSI